MIDSHLQGEEQSYRKRSINLSTDDFNKALFKLLLIKAEREDGGREATDDTLSS